MADVPRSPWVHIVKHSCRTDAITFISTAFRHTCEGLIAAPNLLRHCLQQVMRTRVFYKLSGCRTCIEPASDEFGVIVSLQGFGHVYQSSQVARFHRTITGRIRLCVHGDCITFIAISQASPIRSSSSRSGCDLDAAPNMRRTLSPEISTTHGSPQGEHLYRRSVQPLSESDEVCCDGPIVASTPESPG